MVARMRHLALVGTDPEKSAQFYENALGLLKEAGRRAVYVLDRTGIVRYKWIGPSDDPGALPSVDEVLVAARTIPV